MTISEQPSPKCQPRPAKPDDDGPWAWCAKAALRLIRAAMDCDPFLDQVLAVYLVLCELASDSQRSEFTVARREIARRSGVSLRRVAEVLSRLRSVGLLTWKQNAIPGTKELGPSTFTIMSCTASTTSGTVCTTSGTIRTRLCKNEKRQICTVVEESNEESFKNQKEGEGTPAPSLSAAERISAEKELQRVESAIKDVRDSYASHQDITGDDRSKLSQFRKRKEELKQRLGWKV